MSNLATNLKDAVGQHPNRPALRLGSTTWTYAQLDELSACVAGGLLAHGLRPGDRVEIELPDVPAFPVLYYGVLRVGAIAVTKDPQRPVRELWHRPGDTRRARLGFTWARGATEGVARDATVRVPVGADFFDQLAFWPRHWAVASRSDREVAIVTETPASAGAGTVQEVAVTHGTLRADAFTAAVSMDLHAHDTIPCDQPLFHAVGQAHGLNAVVLAGACLSFPASTNARPGRHGSAPAAPAARGAFSRPVQYACSYSSGGR
ncbi:hypothetical protein Kpho02_50670 [Kitasatospora phosalacinea]|uniref:AMP-dependent synthetase/ligase domain-containing protein n=1 Tax=Kitasatospora phosalacinea TaxID=2065 RepID=A0A9W6V410_9ACTN|nr:AMP-binding protein [Kitasatospora phosalacinea]GLW72768.1 hypothetical protein Kpho02_50670 [Kitasatospora phosalacinea]